MARVAAPVCGNCNKRMTRTYVRDESKAFRGVGWLCYCGSHKLDDEVDTAMTKAWEYLKRRGE